MITDTDAIADLEHEIAVLVRRHRALLAAAGADAPSGLTPAEYGLLLRLDRHGPHRTTELAEYAAVVLSTMSRQLQALESHGLIERLPSPEDGRAHVVALTDEGRHRVARARAERGRRLRDRLGAWADVDIRTLTGLLAKFNSSTDRGDNRRSPLEAK
ncbi:MarR family winged helix-turn-helix transcriptional regulator [Actinoplanes sp. RD1]|uniref:MarR family winged helix-turn-helix transcriptional regulator n=1 Tax=Actinoplanes sp. RD1 TaxID=3064538 RepID=UPI0027409340|nr:MarR family transcriptional regulator [Actinoplanes sp. RD1]